MQAGARPAGPEHRFGGTPPVKDRAGPAAVPFFRGYALETRLSDRAAIEVWRASGPGGARVALKCVHQGHHEQTLVALQAEFAQSSRLQHRAIVRVQDWLTEPPWHGIAFEYLAGGDWVALAGSAVRSWVHQAVDLVDALAYLHGLGLVHRDLKARNVRLDAENRLRLIDFGSCLPVGAAWTAAGTTAEHRPAGWLGETVAVGHDVYALAALLAEMLAGGIGRQAKQAALTATPAKKALIELIDHTLDGTPEDCARDLPRFSAVLIQLAAECVKDE
jgi:serine/threonine protein kinase